MRIPLSATAVLLVFALANAPVSAQQKSSTEDFEQTLRTSLRNFLAGKGVKKEERKFFRTVAQHIVDAAHPTNRGVDLESYRIEVDPLRRGCYAVVLRASYFGRFTSTAYPAEIRIAIESDNPGWTVTKLEFQETHNSIAANQRNLAKLKEHINNVLEN
jgi:hypothetical protein